MSEIKRFEYNWAGRPLVVEIGEMAKQANGACLVKYGDSVVLTAVCSKDAKANQDFFPLMVIYQEKLYAAGKIPGGFLRREGRPSEHETLTSRLIDRPIRPMFDEGYLDEVQIVNTVLSSDQDATAEMAAMIGSSVALMISDIPFLGPIAGVNVGYVDGQYLINPTKEQEKKSSIQLTVAGSADAINMVEAGANEVSEDEMFGALKFGHEEIQRLCNFQNEIAKACAKEKVVPALFELDKNIEKETKDFAFEKLIKAIRIEEKTARYKAIDDVFAETMEHFGQRNFIKEVEDFKVLDNDAKSNFLKHVKLTLENILHEEVRRLITVDKVRPDGRKQDEIRPLSSRVDVLPRTHGSALFTRGQTQSLSVTTLGALNETQIIDGLNEIEQNKRFMLHYNFPQYSVGETGRYGSPGRREIGHGALGERAILAVIPSEEEFPYTIRLVSEIIESNGSTSQASICAGVLSLMAAGVPLKAPVAGIAMGLIMEGKDYTILSDIQGMEDHLGDMDFKVAGTSKGITALQMDMKIRGITFDILKESLAQAKLGRLHILEHMVSTINTPREEVSTTAPKVKMIKIQPAQIKDVIGAGGKVINQIIEDSGNVKIDIEQDGRVYLMHQDLKNVLKAKQIIEDLLKAPEVGQMYPAKVVRIEKFGCFVELWPGCEGLVHVSKLDDKRVEKVEDVVSLGDTIIVKCININEKGQIDLSRKDAISEAPKVDKQD